MDKERKRQTGFRIVTVIISASLVLVAADLYYGRTEAQGPKVSSTKPKPVTEAPAPSVQAKPYVVADGDIIKNLVLTGELRAARYTSIISPDIRSSNANMITYLAPEGTQIKKGERIVEFDDSTLLSNKSEAERTLDEAKLNIEKTKVDLESQRCDLLNSLSQAEAQLKQDELYGKISKELLPANTYQKYQLNLEKSRLALKRARERMDNFEKSYASELALVEITKSQAEINLKKIESDMTLLKVDAPQDGILIYGDNWQSNRKIQPGDTVFEGMEVASLPDLSSMQVIGYVYDTEYGALAKDMRCTVSFDALPGYTVDGRIVGLTSVASRKGFFSQKKVFQATVELDRVDVSLMKPGMTARIKIPLVLARSTPAVPREYLGIDTQGKSYVLRKTEKEQAARQEVTPGAIGDALIQIVSGVSPGDSLLPIR